MVAHNRIIGYFKPNKIAPLKDYLVLVIAEDMETGEERLVSKHGPFTEDEAADYAEDRAFNFLTKDTDEDNFTKFIIIPIKNLAP